MHQALLWAVGLQQQTKQPESLSSWSFLGPRQGSSMLNMVSGSRGALRKNEVGRGHGVTGQSKETSLRSGYLSRNLVKPGSKRWGCLCSRQREGQVHSPGMGLSGEQQGGTWWSSGGPGAERRVGGTEATERGGAGHPRGQGFCFWLSSEVCRRCVSGWPLNPQPSLRSFRSTQYPSAYAVPFLKILTTIRPTVCSREPCSCRALPDREEDEHIQN